MKRSVTVNPMALGVLPLRPGLPPVLLEARAHRTRPPAHPAIAELIELLRTTLSGRPERQLGTV